MACFHVCASLVRNLPLGKNVCCMLFFLARLHGARLLPSYSSALTIFCRSLRL